MNSPTNSAALPPMAGSLPPHKVVKERISRSLNGVYYRLVHKDTGRPLVLGIIGETRDLARANTLEALRAENVREHPTSSADGKPELENKLER